ncbi:gamma-butyrobetaine dioxygenase-like isoform X1 [Haliotis rufescens]|uniref:gamma-butyrobetaine dioxygenase-like isoform X1 n=1 Tax=Haliotis rufescens TaxID=6454 RepID=UPI00201EEA0B|nr:gamma-butyrobetaine dioxygenase-like isoform X1 [Haliotis rufescens]
MSYCRTQHCSTMYRAVLRLCRKQVLPNSIQRWNQECRLLGLSVDSSSKRLASNTATSPSKSSYESLVERKLFLKTAFARSATAKVAAVTTVDGGKNVEIKWDDGSISKYHSMWLRQSCHCPSCRLSTNQPIVNFMDVNIDATVSDARLDGDKVLKVIWSDDKNHMGLFPVPFLKHYSYSDKSLTEIKNQRKMVFSSEAQIPEVAYSDVMGSDTGLFQWLNHLNKYGICLVKNVPTQEMTIKKVVERIAPIQSSVYGEIFDVKDTPQPINFAYTPVRLELHMDQPMYESPPGLQFLHCLRFDKQVTGGKNFFVDLFHVAHRLREEYPKEFQDLVRIPVNWETVHYDRDFPVHMSYQRPHISLNSDGEIVGVTWHPGLGGPLLVKEEDVEPYFRAYKVMATLLNNFPSQYRHRMQEGDMISFNNRRVLHGRESYNPHDGIRHYQGCYVQIDEFKSQVQVFSNKIGDGKLATRVGNLDLQ